MPRRGVRTRAVTAHRADLSPKPSRWGYVAGCGGEEGCELEREYSRAYKRKVRARHREVTSGETPATPQHQEGEKRYA